MSRGIYITANDRVSEQAIALISSIRFYDKDTPIILIPYDDQYQEIAQLLLDYYGVKLYQNLQLIERLSQKLADIFGEDFFTNPNRFRKYACWFGELDEFLYVDTDVIVFEKIIDNLKYLTDYDFICCDYQHNEGTRYIFTPTVREKGVFGDSELKDVFNSGFWASKKKLISEKYLYDIWAECAKHPEYFDFAQKVSDQPLLNYMILKHIKRRINLVRTPIPGAGNWAGSSRFQRQGNVLVDPLVDQPLKYLHWAGIRLEPECPYWDLWEYYRYLNIPNSDLAPSLRLICEDGEQETVIRFEEHQLSSQPKTF